MPGITSPMTPINREPGNIAYEFLGISPPDAGELPSAAAADHTHQVGNTVRQVAEFGLAQGFATSDSGSGGHGYAGMISSVALIPSLRQWTIECWVTNFFGGGGGGATGFGMYQATGSTNPIPTGLPSLDTLAGAQGDQIDGNTFRFPDGSSGAALPSLSGTNHFAISCDGTATRSFLNGVLVDTKAAMTLFNSLAVFGFAADNPGSTTTFDEFRVSSTGRYSAAFTPATAPFAPDAETEILWHLDDGPLGQWGGVPAPNSNATGTEANAAFDSSGNNDNGFLWWALTNGIGGLGASFTVTGVISPVTPGSGDAPKQSTVLSLQAQTGDLVLTNTVGASVASPVPQSDGTIQLQLSGLGGPVAKEYEQEITVLTAVTVLTYTPVVSGLFQVDLYFRVAGNPTTVAVQVTATDATGAQTWNPLPSASQPVGSYQIDSIVVACIAGDPIDVIVTVGTINQVFFSAGIKEA
ncbi:MAG TPA: hypothetical protein VMV23_09430 [Candidatus Nanopelagicaceae bacterium]|nr:hypothetical protein [Candidatus Nanopelagicaceae bacterium]